MPPESRQSLVQALLNKLPEPASPVVISVRPERPVSSPVRTNGHRTNPSAPSYDPSLVFVLELATIFATRDQRSVGLMGQAVADALQTLIRDAANVHPLVLSRAIFYLLYLLNASQVIINYPSNVCTAKSYIGSFICPSTCHTPRYRRLRAIDFRKGCNADFERTNTMHT